MKPMNAETKQGFTPGQWRVYVEPAIDYRAPLIITDESCIALLQGGGPKRAIAGPEQKANAKLIASAPALLEACKHALEDLEKLNVGHASIEDVCGIIPELKSTITAATGGSTHD